MPTGSAPPCNVSVSLFREGAVSGVHLDTAPDAEALAPLKNRSGLNQTLGPSAWIHQLDVTSRFELFTFGGSVKMRPCQCEG